MTKPLSAPAPPLSSAAGHRFATRMAELGSRLYGPRPPLGDDHPVEGEVRGDLVHPDDRVDPSEVGRLRNEERARWDALYANARRCEHPVDVPTRERSTQ